MNRQALKYVPLIAGIVAFAIGAVGLLGWVLDLDSFKRIHPAFVTMKANTAICLMLAAVSLLLLRDPAASGARRVAAHVLGVFVVLVGGLTLAEHLFRLNVGIDQLVFKESDSQAGQSFPGRMGVAASLNFLFLGLALLLMDVKLAGKYWPASFFAVAAGTITLLVFLYYFYGVEIEPIAKYSTIALHTVLALIALSAGILFARPDQGIMASLLGNGPGSVMARRILPAALFLPIILGWLRVMGQSQALYGTAFGTAVFAGLIVLVFTVLVSRTAVALNRTDAQRTKAEDSLRNVALLAAQNPAPVLRVSRDGVLLYANHAALTEFNDWNLDVGQRVPRHVIDPVAQVLKARQIREEEQKIGAKEYLLTLVPIPDAAYVNLYWRDITERKRAEEQLRESEQRFRHMADAAPVLIWISDTNKLCTWFNKRWLEFVGRSMKQELGSGWTENVHPDDLERCISTCHGAFDARESFSVEYRLKRHDGQYRWVTANGVPLFGPDRQFSGFIGSCMDITAHKEAEDGLRRAAERQRILSEALAHLLSADQPEKIVRELFPKVAAHLGVDTYFNYMLNEQGDALELHSSGGISEEIINKIRRLGLGQAICGTVAQIKQPIIAADIQNSDYDKAALVRSFGIQAYACNPLMSGDRLLGTLSFATRTRPHFNEGELEFLKLISNYVAVAMERARAEQALRESENRLRLAQQVARVGAFEWNIQTGKTIWTPELEVMYGLKPGEFDGTQQSWELLVYEEDRPRAAKRVQQAMQTGNFADEWRVVWPDGTIRWLAGRATVFKDPVGRPVKMVGINIDITERKKVEQALRESEAVLRTVTNEAQVGLVMVDKERRYLFANHTYAEILGLQDANIVGKSVKDVLAQLYDQIRPELDLAFKGERVQYELHLAAHPKTGNERYYEVVYQPRTEHVQDPYVVVVMVDVTDRKKMQQTLEETVAERTAKLRETIAELESYSYSISHDMRGPLRAMQTYSHVLLSDYSERLDDTGKRYLDRIITSSHRLDKLIQDVLTYSRVARTEVKLEPVNLDRLLHDLINDYPTLRAANVEIVHPLGSVAAVEALLTQAISNLLTNAAKFVAPGETPRLKIWSEPATLDTQLAVKLYVRDNGIGIAPEDQQRIFGIFARVHSEKEYEGTGIGLSIVKKAVERMGGRMGLDSQVGQGSTFWIQLPKA
jgi:PAS domain S-box-containing protein